MSNVVPRSRREAAHVAGMDVMFNAGGALLLVVIAAAAANLASGVAKDEPQYVMALTVEISNSTGALAVRAEGGTCITLGSGSGKSVVVRLLGSGSVAAACAGGKDGAPVRLEVVALCRGVAPRVLVTCAEGVRASLDILCGDARHTQPEAEHAVPMTYSIGYVASSIRISQGEAR